jgi:hypothetical protein
VHLDLFRADPGCEACWLPGRDQARKHSSINQRGPTPLPLRIPAREMSTIQASFELDSMISASRNLSIEVPIRLSAASSWSTAEPGSIRIDSSPVLLQSPDIQNSRDSHLRPSARPRYQIEFPTGLQAPYELGRRRQTHPCWSDVLYRRVCFFFKQHRQRVLKCTDSNRDSWELLYTRSCHMCALIARDWLIVSFLVVI